MIICTISGMMLLNKVLKNVSRNMYDLPRVAVAAVGKRETRLHKSPKATT